MPDDQTATQELATLRAALKGLEEEMREQAEDYAQSAEDGPRNSYGAGVDTGIAEASFTWADRLAALREGQETEDHAR